MKDILKVQYGLYKVLGELVTDISYADGLFNGIYIPWIYLDCVVDLSWKKLFKQYKLMFKIVRKTLQTNT